MIRTAISPHGQRLKQAVDVRVLRKTFNQAVLPIDIKPVATRPHHRAHRPSEKLGPSGTTMALNVRGGDGRNQKKKPAAPGPRPTDT